MKRYATHLFLIALGTLLALIAIAQVPAGLLPAGIILGNSTATGGVSGTAKFSMSTGAITGLVVTGCVTGVSRTGTGAASVTVSGCPTNYVISTGVGDTVAGVTVQIDPIASYGTSGFTLQGLSNNTNPYDPGLVFVVIP